LDATTKSIDSFRCAWLPHARIRSSILAYQLGRFSRLSPIQPPQIFL